MTIQKAMRIRSELKKAADDLFELLANESYVISFEGDKMPTEEEVNQARNQNRAGLDGMTYKNAVKKLFAITDACLTLNIAIEEANKIGHDALFKETSLKSKLAVVDLLLQKGRRVQPITKIEKTDFSHTDAKGNFERKEINSYNFPTISTEDFGMSLPDFRKSLCKDLATVRDDLAAFNAKTEVNYTLPEGLI